MFGRIFFQRIHFANFRKNNQTQQNIFFTLTIFFADSFQENVWRKRGISLVPVKYDIKYYSLPFYCHLSVYEGDGTVSVSTGGIEMGQGLNTKVNNIVITSILSLSHTLL